MKVYIAKLGDGPDDYKICINCGLPFFKNKNDKNWRKRKCCNVNCRTKLSPTTRTTSMPRNAFCEYCNVPLVRIGRKYCNKECYNKHRIREKRCKFCNKTIPKDGLTQSAYVNRKYCKNTLCRLRYRQRNILTP